MISPKNDNGKTPDYNVCAVYTVYSTCSRRSARKTLSTFFWLPLRSCLFLSWDILGLCVLCVATAPTDAQQENYARRITEDRWGKALGGLGRIYSRLVTVVSPHAESTEY